MLLSKCKQTLRWRVNVLTVYRCPHRRAFVLDHGIVGDTPTGELVRGFSFEVNLLAYLSLQYVSCPLHKRNFSLTCGKGLSDTEYDILAFQAREDPENENDIQLFLPPKQDIDAVLGTEKWVVRQAESEALGLNAATQVEFVGMKEGSQLCGDPKFEW